MRLSSFTPTNLVSIAISHTVKKPSIPRAVAPVTRRSICIMVLAQKMAELSTNNAWIATSRIAPQRKSVKPV